MGWLSKAWKKVKKTVSSFFGGGEKPQEIGPDPALTAALAASRKAAMDANKKLKAKSDEELVQRKRRRRGRRSLFASGHSGRGFRASSGGGLLKKTLG